MVTRRTHGYTLVELLIVIMIAVMLMAITLPVAKTVMEDGRPREASRILNATLAAVKARAVQTNRLAGLDFVCERMNDPMAMTPVYQVTQLYMCEVPPMYAGDIVNARVAVNIDTMTPNNSTLNFGGGAGSLFSLLDSNESPRTFKIRINHRGPWYNCTTSDGMTYYILLKDMPYPPTGDANGYAYQILRPPVRIGNPIELPKATALDMTYSGVGPIGRQFATTDAVRVMFGPQGNVQDIIVRTAGGGIVSGAPNGTLHFLIGQTGKITDASNYNNVELSNLADGNMFWVSIGHSSGLVTTSENLPGDASAALDVYVRACRDAAISREQKGGL